MASQENQELRLLFALFDVDNSGTLTRDELKQLLESPDPISPSISDEQLNVYLELADTDNSGDISLDEFLTFMNNNVLPGAYGLKGIFRTIDKSGDDIVEKDEFEQAKLLNKDLNSTLIAIFDKKFQSNAISKITYEEFVEDVREYYTNRPKN